MTIENKNVIIYTFKIAKVSAVMAQPEKTSPTATSPLPNPAVCAQFELGGGRSLASVTSDAGVALSFRENLQPSNRAESFRPWSGGAGIRALLAGCGCGVMARLTFCRIPVATS